MENVNSAEEFEEKLTEAFKEFMKHDKSFNVQGSWTGEDDVTVSVLVDYSIESREGDYYVGSISARKSDNEGMDEEEIVTSDTFYDAQCALKSAINSIFCVPYGELRPEILESDMDYSAHYNIAHGFWGLKVEREDVA
jgi:hypothetical protein